MKKALFALLLWAPLAVPQEPIPATLFGMHVGPWGNWPTVSFGAAGKVPGATWEYVEQPRGVWNWAALDGLVAASRARGVEAFAVVAGRVPCWAAPAAQQGGCITLYTGKLAYTGMPANLADWDNYVTALVSRYKSTGVQAGCAPENPQCHGVIQNYELWNEPENYFTGDCATCSRTAASTIQGVATLTQRAYGIIRATDQAAKIIAPSFVGYAGTYMDQYYALGGPLGVDAVSIHAYPSNLATRGVPESMIDPNEKYQLMTRIPIWQKYGLGSKPIWNTEGSWSLESAGATTDPDLQMAFVARYYLLHWSAGVRRGYWYLWEDNPGGWGFFRNHQTGEIRPAAGAYTQTFSWMVGATMPAPCTRNGADVYNSVYSCMLTRENGYQALAVWDTRGPSTFTVPSQYKQYRDLAGNTVPITSSQVAIGLKPILLETVPDTIPPVISNIQVTPEKKSAAISWTTDEPTTGLVEYGLTEAYGAAVPVVGVSTSAAVTINGLKPGTKYHFRVRSQDEAGNFALSGNGTFFTPERRAVVELTESEINGLLAFVERLSATLQ